jgi:arylsulfatase
MKDNLLQGFMILALGGVLAGQVVMAAEPSKPNILVILTDDMGFSDLGCYGGEIRTPNLDQLAAQGLRFTQFYNAARCCPTRASLLMGLYPHQAAIGHMEQPRGALEGYQGDLSRHAVTLAEVLKTAGYGTYAVGKWHVTQFNVKLGWPLQPKRSQDNWPLQRGFDRFYGIIGGGGSYFEPSSLARDNTPITAHGDPEYQPESYYFTDAVTDQAIHLLAAHHQKQPGQPFFMYVAHTAPHNPLHAREEDIAKYQGKYAHGYEPIRKARFERAKQLGVIDKGWDLSTQAKKWDLVENKAWESRCMEVYAAQIERMDHGVGRIVAELKNQGQLENTLILYLHDNGACSEPTGRSAAPQSWGGRTFDCGPEVMPGPANTFIAYGEGWANVSNTPFRYYKHYVHEGGIATPLIAHWPARIKYPSGLVSQPGHLVDIMATCVEVAGAGYPEQFHGNKIPPMEGRSLVPAFVGGKLADYPIGWEHEGNRALRQGKWKLVAKGAEGPWELYDMENDRTEMHDLAQQNPKQVHELGGQWETWARRTHVIPWPWGGKYGPVVKPGK